MKLLTSLCTSSELYRHRYTRRLSTALRHQNIPPDGSVLASDNKD